MKKRIKLGDKVRLVGEVGSDANFEINCFFVQKKKPCSLATLIVSDYWELVKRPFLVAGGNGNYCPVALLIKVK